MSRRFLLAIALTVLALLTSFGAVAGQEATPAIVTTATTDDPSLVLISQLHIFLVPSGGLMQVMEFYVISNMGDANFVGRQEAGAAAPITMDFTLPAEATNLTLDDPDADVHFVERPEGFAYTQPIAPGTGTTTIRFGYEMPYIPGALFERRFGAPVMSVVLLVTGESMTLNGEGLGEPTVRDTEMGPATYYAAGPLVAGQPLAFTVNGEPPATVVTQPGEEANSAAPEQATTQGGRNRMSELLIGLATLALAAGGAYLLWHRPGQAVAMPAWARPSVTAIAALDSDFEAGRLAREPYSRRRATLKRQLEAELRRRGASRA